MKSQQREILDAIVAHVRTVVPADFETVEAVRSLRLLSENVGRLVAVIPRGISWKTTAKGRVRTEHRVDLVVLSRDDPATFDTYVSMLDAWARLFLLNDVEALDQWPCLEAETIDGADAGYDVEALEETPGTYVGGLRLTFWGD